MQAAAACCVRHEVDVVVSVRAARGGGKLVICPPFSTFNCYPIVDTVWLILQNSIRGGEVQRGTPSVTGWHCHTIQANRGGDHEYDCVLQADVTV